jgi:hypothetical protein
LAIGIIIGTAPQARAEGFISPLIGFDFGGDSGCPNLNNCQDKKINVSVSFGAMGNVLGFEEEVAYAPNFFGNAPGLSSSVLTLMSNVMLVPNLGPVRPYVLAGIGLIKTHVELTTASVFTTDNNNLGWDVGGGLMDLSAITSGCASTFATSTPFRTSPSWGSRWATRSSTTGARAPEWS